MVDKPRPSVESRQTGTPRGGGGTRTVFSLSEEETVDLGRSLAHGLRGGELILLVGDLGLGKTVFARGVAIGLDVAAEDVSSPSFTLIQEYRGGRLPIFHVDLYRLHDAEELGTLGLDEILATDAVVVVEWGEKLPPFYTREAVRVDFHDVGEGCRRIELSGIAPTPERRGDA